MSLKVEIVRQIYAAGNERDFDRLEALTHPDLVFDFSRSMGPEKGIYRGHDEYELTPVDFRIAPAGRIVVRHHVRANGTGSGAEWENALEAVRLRE